MGNRSIYGEHGESDHAVGAFRGLILSITAGENSAQLTPFRLAAPRSIPSAPLASMPDICAAGLDQEWLQAAALCPPAPGCDPRTRALSTGDCVFQNAGVRPVLPEAPDAALPDVQPARVLVVRAAERPGQQVGALGNGDDVDVIGYQAPLFDRYVGRYQLPDFILTITRGEDGLYAEPTNLPKFKIFTEGERVFFLKAVDAQITFEFGADGRASALVLRRHGGIEERGKRIE